MDPYETVNRKGFIRTEVQFIIVWTMKLKSVNKCILTTHNQYPGTSIVN